MGPSSAPVSPKTEQNVWERVGMSYSFPPTPALPAPPCSPLLSPAQRAPAPLSAHSLCLSPSPSYFHPELFPGLRGETIKIHPSFQLQWPCAFGKDLGDASGSTVPGHDISSIARMIMPKCSLISCLCRCARVTEMQTHKVCPLEALSKLLHFSLSKPRNRSSQPTSHSPTLQPGRSVGKAALFTNLSDLPPACLVKWLSMSSLPGSPLNKMLASGLAWCGSKAQNKNSNSNKA